MSPLLIPHAIHIADWWNGQCWLRLRKLPHQLQSCQIPSAREANGSLKDRWTASPPTWLLGPLAAQASYTYFPRNGKPAA